MRDDASLLHLDMDAFFAAVEVQADPSLAGRPVIVGGTGDRGVVASATYEARAFGVRSAMPTARARRLCPHGVFLPGRFDAYAAVSRRLHAVLESVTPLVEGVSLDEAFLDVSGARRLLGPGAAAAAHLRERVQRELGLWSSVGAATNKLLAKLASEAAKPTATLAGPVPGPGVVVVPPGGELAFLHPHPVTALWGVGPATLRRLARFGVRTVGDLAALPEDALVHALGPAQGRHLHALAWGRDERPVVPHQRAKSVGHEQTYARDLRAAADLHREVVRLSDAVAARLRAAGTAGRTVTLKVRFGDFRTITRSRTLPSAIDTGPDLARAAAALLDGVDVAGGVRLLGVSVSNLAAEEALQLELGAAGGWRAASGAVDEVRRRFGARAVGPAALLEPGGLGVRRRGDQQWGPAGGRPS